MMLWLTTDLPEPDSPTSATVLPLAILKETPRTASSLPSGREKDTRKSWTRRRS